MQTPTKMIHQIDNFVLAPHTYYQSPTQGSISVEKCKKKTRKKSS